MKNRATGFDREQVVNIPLNQGTTGIINFSKKNCCKTLLLVALLLHRMFWAVIWINRELDLKVMDPNDN